MADIVILTLIIGYCVFLIYRGYKNKKAGKPVGLRRVQRKLQILRRLCVLRREKNGCERKVAYGRFYRLHVLWLRSIYSYIYYRSDDLSDLALDQESERPEEIQRKRR